MKMKKYGSKLAVAAMAVIVIVVGSILIAVINATNSMVGNMLTGQSKTANKAFMDAFENYQTQAIQRAEMIAGSGDVVNAILDGDHDKLLAALKNLSQGLDLITLCDTDGNVLVRTHSSKTGDSVLNQNAIKTALSTGKGIKTIEPGTEIGLSTRGSAAIKDANGNIIGALTCGHDLSQSKYVDAIKATSGCEITFFAGDTRMSTTLTNEKGERVVGTKADANVIDVVINSGKEYTARIPLFGSTYEVCYSPISTNGKIIGMLFSGVLADSVLEQQRSMVVMIIVAFAMLICAVAITVLLIIWMSKKTYWYESILDSITFPLSVTDMDMNWTFINKPVEQMLGIKREDVIGKHCSTWNAAICNTDECGINCLRRGKTTTMFSQIGLEFKVDISYLKNTQGKNVGHIELVQDITSIINTQKIQAALIEDVNQISHTFAVGAKQIADGSRGLAQGSTEQAAAVEQLSASIMEITQLTNSNAEMAEKAADLAVTIKQKAEKGNQQMSQMLNAVKEINDAGLNINKVIKVIDDIAFQTNILALNAAVEAARAGQHGKGFAVVAEEVRSLAAKSADAAKNTSTLIANSIEKSEFGSQIAQETAASLVEIVTGINESSQIVSTIAKASVEQSSSISQISKGVEQVSQVVQQNSATAQQSAAASQELNNQAAALGDLITQFSKDSGSHHVQDGSVKQSALPKKSQENTTRTPSTGGGDYGKY